MNFLSNSIEQLFQEIPLPIWVGAIAAIVVLIIEIKLMKKGILFGGGDRKLERAKQAGHVLDATLVNHWISSNGKHRSTYEYFINGNIRKKYHLITSWHPNSHIKLYYVNTPDKVFSEHKLGRNPLKILLYIVPALVAIAVAKLLGYEVEPNVVCLFWL